jgi:hypothetical protein
MAGKLVFKFQKPSDASGTPCIPSDSQAALKALDLLFSD